MSLCTPGLINSATLWRLASQMFVFHSHKNDPMYVKHTQMYTKACTLDALDALLELSGDEISNDPLS